jgi:hypothetical protein
MDGSEKVSTSILDRVASNPLKSFCLAFGSVDINLSLISLTTAFSFHYCWRLRRDLIGNWGVEVIWKYACARQMNLLSLYQFVIRVARRAILLRVVHVVGTVRSRGRSKLSAVCCKTTPDLSLRSELKFVSL